MYSIKAWYIWHDIKALAMTHGPLCMSTLVRKAKLMPKKESLCMHAVLFCGLKNRLIYTWAADHTSVLWSFWGLSWSSVSVCDGLIQPARRCFTILRSSVADSMQTDMFFFCLTRRWSYCAVWKREWYRSSFDFRPFWELLTLSVFPPFPHKNLCITMWK